MFQSEKEVLLVSELIWLTERYSTEEEEEEVSPSTVVLILTDCCTQYVTPSTVVECTMSKTKRIVTSDVCISRTSYLLACETQALSVFVCGGQPPLWFVFL